MYLPILFSSFVISSRFFWRVSCDMDLDSLKEAIAFDDIGMVNKYLNSENRQRVLHEALIKAVEKDLLMQMIERMEPRTDSRLRLPGNGALHWAVMKSAPKVTRLLLENGADVNILNFEGETPLFIAAKQSANPYTSREMCAYVKVIDTLFEFNADIHIRNDLGLTPLLCAAGGCKVLLVAKLLERGANINDWWMGRRKTPLHRAVHYGCVEMTKFLLENGAEADAYNRYGENALHIIFDTTDLLWISLRSSGEKDQSAIAKLLLRSENAENMLKQRENRHLKTPVDIFFEVAVKPNRGIVAHFLQSDLNREILVDLLKILPSLDDAYAESALRTFSPSLVQHSSTWPLDNFSEYVKVALNSYKEILSKEKSKKKICLNAFTEFFCRITGITPISSIYDMKSFIKKGLYSLYVILRTRFQIHRGEDREEAAREVEQFDEYLSGLSVPFQNSLWNAFVKGTTLEILPTDILTTVFQDWEYARFIQRFVKTISLIQFTGWWSVEEILDAAPTFIHYIEEQEILLHCDY